MWERRNEIDFPTNLAYMMANINRFAQAGFVPTNEDVLHARQRTTGVVETNFVVRLLISLYIIVKVPTSRLDHQMALVLN